MYNYVKMTPRTHYTQGLWANNWNLVKILFALIWCWWPNHATILHMPWQLSCHGMCKIVTWSDHYCSHQTIHIFTRFGWWAHKPFVKWVLANRWPDAAWSVSQGDLEPMSTRWSAATLVPWHTGFVPANTWWRTACHVIMQSWWYKPHNVMLNSVLLIYGTSFHVRFKHDNISHNILLT